MNVNNPQIIIEGPDKVGKDSLIEYIHTLSNFRYCINSRGILSQLVYNDKYHRHNTYTLSYKPLIIFLTADYESDEITQKAIDFSDNLKLKSIIYNQNDYIDVDNLLSPFILVIPLEWFIYYLAHYNGEDPGATRHIGKVRY